MTEQNIPHPAFQKLLAACKTLPPVVTAIVHPCDTATLLAIADAEKHGLITPVLVGPKSKILNSAAEAGVDISAYPLVDTPHSHASAESALDLVRQGKAAALMKGSLHTDELLEPALDRIQGIRTERRISHCFVMAMPGRAEPFIVSDAAVNIAPTLAEKADIVQNAIDLATALHWTDLRVAILSATEMINPAIKSTLDAAALCKMADRGQITGALIDGPLAFDNATDQAAVNIGLGQQGRRIAGIHAAAVENSHAVGAGAGRLQLLAQHQMQSQAVSSPARSPFSSVKFLSSRALPRVERAPALRYTR